MPPTWKSGITAITRSESLNPSISVAAVRALDSSPACVRVAPLG